MKVWRSRKYCREFTRISAAWITTGSYMRPSSPEKMTIVCKYFTVSEIISMNRDCVCSGQFVCLSSLCEETPL